MLVLLSDFDKSNNLIYEISELEKEDLPSELKLFLNYSIRKKEFDFTSSEVVSALGLMIKPSVFGKLLYSNLDVLEKEGLYINDARKSDKRRKHALYEEPIFENE